MKRLDKIRHDRLEKVANLRQQGIDPYPQPLLDKRQLAAQAPELVDQTMQLAGRVMRLRGHGALVFADLEDSSGRLQLLIKLAQLTEKQQQVVKLLDVGDHVMVEGQVGHSRTGQLSLIVSQIELLAKSIRPLPDKYHGLKDIEERYRQRYVDLLINPEVRQVFRTRTKVVRFLRQYLDDHGFWEVETPVLQPIYGGASARPFVTHHNALDIDLYLRISDELYLKRMMVAGWEKVYELSKDFRNEGISREHNPEFTMLEFYWAYVDYQFLMQFTEQMLSQLIQKIKGSQQLSYQGKVYDFTPPLPRQSMHQLFQQYLEIDLDQAKDLAGLKSLSQAKQLLPADYEYISYGQTLDEIYKKHIRPQLQGPIFVTDYPAEMIPLAKRKSDQPDLVASFQLVINGSELIKAYNELNDPQDQRQRWLAEQKLAASGLEDYQPLDHDYLRALEYGMPPTAGWGMGIDRLVALLTDQPSLKDVILFPTLRPEEAEPAND